MPDELSLEAMQREVDEWTRDEGGYWPPLAMLAALTEEVGEIARLLNHMEGHKPKKSDEGEQELALELCDAVYAIICIANSHGLDLPEAWRRVMAKYEERDRGRFL